MILEQILIVTVVIVLSIFFGLYFFLKSRRQSRQHQLGLMVLNDTIGLHRKQIGERHKALNKYDFLKYNLTEALKVQLQIKL